MTHQLAVPRPIARRRIAGTVITHVAAALAVAWGLDSARRYRQFDAWQTAEPTRFSVDLSRVGTTDAVFTQTCQTSHGQSLLLSIDGAPPHPLDELRGRVELIDPAGQTVLSNDLTPSAESGRADGALTLAYFHSIHNGSYTLRLHVTTPAAALAGRPQTVFSNYMLCGMEQIPAFITAVLSTVAGIVALTVGGFTGTGLIRHGWRQAPRRASGFGYDSYVYSAREGGPP